jgi:hypothetical protein
MVKNEWIPVEKKLPKKGEYVFVVVDEKGYDVDELLDDNPMRWNIEGRVTHWFPVPSYSDDCKKKWEIELVEYKRNAKKESGRDSLRE